MSEQGPFDPQQPPYGTVPGYPPTTGAWYPQPGYPQPGYPQPQRTNGYAIAALCCGIGSFVCGLSAIAAIVLGFVGRSQIKASNGQDKGNGLALAGIIIGAAYLVLLIGFIILSIVIGSTSSNSLGVLVSH